jgi:flagellar motor switch protein FliG
MSDDGLRKSAILLMSLGETGAAAVFQHLSARDIEKLSMAMSKLTQVTREQIAEVMEEFRTDTEQFSAISLNSSDYIRSVLNKALGSDRAADLIDEILESRDATASGMENLNRLESNEVAELIRDEHPQIIATLLVHLDRLKAAEVLELLTERLRQDVILRVATFGGVQPVALDELTEVLTGMLSGQGVKRSRLGGTRAAAEILNLMNSAQEENVIQHMREHDETLAQRVVDEMFLFENLLDIEDRGIQLLRRQSGLADRRPP